MTKEEILAMVPGRELDTLIAKHVMEYRATYRNEPYRGEVIDWMYGDNKARSEDSFSPSTDISAAWEVVEKFNEIRVRRFETMHGHCYVCKIDMYNHGDYPIIAQGDTAPEAICKVALIAVIERKDKV